MEQEEIEQAIDVLEEAREKCDERYNYHDSVMLDEAKAILEVGWLE